MNTTNQENEHMTYEIYKPTDPQLKKETPIFKQSKHDYTIRSEWSAEVFEFWEWKKNTNQNDQSHQEMNTTNQEMKTMANANTKKQRNDNKSNQKNPNNWRYHKSRENNNWTSKEMKNMPNEKHEWDNRSNQLNPNNDAYYQSRGWDDKDEHDNYDDWWEK